jgi:hypothetical protein
MFFLVLKLIPLGNGDGYAVLAVDASYPDRFIGDLLPSQAPGGSAQYISESTQWVFLDDFGVLQRIPLDEYRDRVEIFDPRDDGYAEKLRSFFLRDGKRLFFIPFSGESLGKWLKKAAWADITFSDTWINKKRINRIKESIAVSLKDTVRGDIPFSIEFFGHEKPLVFYFLLFVLAVAITLVLVEKPWFLVVLLPVLGALVLTGPPGFVICTALIALSRVLIEPIREVLVFCRYRHCRQGLTGPGNPMKGLDLLTNLSSDWIIPLGRVILLLGILGICTIPGMQRIPPGGMMDIPRGKSMLILGAAGFLCGFCILGFILWIKSNQGKPQEHIRFRQVRIMAPANQGIINRTFIPFALVSLMSIYIPQMIEGIYAYHNPELIADHRYLIDPAEYEKHAAFQASFSFIPLGTKGDLSQAQPDRDRFYPNQPYEFRYGRYLLGEDGLIADAGGKINSDNDPVYYEVYTYKDIPPFPLEKLITFLKDFEHTYMKDTSQIATINIMGLVPILLVPGVYIIVLWGLKQNHGKKKNSLVYHDKRIAA